MTNTTFKLEEVELKNDNYPRPTGHRILIKTLDIARNWIDNVPGSTWSYYMHLSASDAQTSDTSLFNGTAPSASVVTLGSAASANDDEGMIAYCFHSVEGYSKVGSYEGNGNADGTFIYTGFRPAYTLIKRIDTTNDWMIGDNKINPYNVTDNMLRANLTAVQQSGNNVDYLSNGFKIRVAGNAFNNSSGTYLYMAFAESPFKTANAR